MIAIIGAGLQGACLALELAARGQAVTVIDAASEPMSEASRWNEGKLHLGFVYANDPSLHSANAMIQASLEFLPNLERLLGRDLSHLVARNRFYYGVPADSQATVTQVAHHFESIALRLAEHAARWPQIFGGQTWDAPAEVPVNGLFARESVLAAFATPEVAVDTHALANLVTARLREEPLVRLVTGVEVVSVSRRAGGFRLDFADGSSECGFSSVVNASWRSLMRLDATAGCHSGRSWLYRYKTAIHIRGSATVMPSCTFIVGPYGDIVNFGDGRFYLSWYPTCRLAMSDQADLPDMADLDAGRRATIVAESLQGLARLIPGVADMVLDEAPDVQGPGSSPGAAATLPIVTVNCIGATMSAPSWTTATSPSIPASTAWRLTTPLAWRGLSWNGDRRRSGTAAFCPWRPAVTWHLIGFCHTRPAGPCGPPARRNRGRGRWARCRPGSARDGCRNSAP